METRKTDEVRTNRLLGVNLASASLPTNEAKITIPTTTIAEIPVVEELPSISPDGFTAQIREVTIPFAKKPKVTSSNA